MNKNEANMILELLIEQAADKSVLEINMWSDHTHSDANKYSIEFRHESAAVAYIMLDAYLAYVGPRTGSNPTKLPHFQYADPNFAENVLRLDRLLISSEVL